MTENKFDEKKFNYGFLMLTTFIISGCSMCYELIISSVSSYLIGDSVLQFSVTIGLYMSAMGLGSYISKYIKKDLFDKFVIVEIMVGIVGGFSSLLLFLANLYIRAYETVMYIEIVVIGTAVGVEIPLLTRIIEEKAKDLRITLSSIFSFDYIGGLVGSVAFPLILLPHLGYFATAFLVGSFNIAIAAAIVVKYREYIIRQAAFTAVCIAAFIIMVFGVVFSENISEFVENGLYRDKVILSQHSPYQHIVLTKHKDDLRMFINGNIQFCSLDEYRYHECLVQVPMSLMKKRDNILILGGGDGLAAREILKHDDVKSITMVDLDKEVIDICRENYDISQLNEKSLESEKLEIINDDAYKYLERTDKKFDLIISDLPDPNDDALNKLYTTLFYRLCKNALNDEGMIVVQSTSPYYAKEAFWCINKTMEKEGLFVKPYHVQVPSFGEWGFQLAAKKEFDVSDIKIDTPCRFLDEKSAEGLFLFGKDEIADKENVEANTIAKPMLIEYYMEAERNWS
ncbi:MAG: polyamine aminopropyltransferase [Firmicutes bacterium]|nr:polyamine aminopropyltransferase [Bacillota bacterium]